MAREQRMAVFRLHAIAGDIERGAAARQKVGKRVALAGEKKSLMTSEGE